ncbi:DUF5688 family protein [Butyrivibrio sp. AC2005]|uniref:DUF5688 family protein n=1 Tax=Butyrivibrio sp. AC2005 TaxID=1280672 RepID=UPI000424BC08|nr:DUF5688 family protein [Butyrivibrio sp. AC2005]
MEITNFSTFNEELINRIQESLGSEFTIQSREAEKLNEKYNALTVKPVDDIIGVNLNATALFVEYENGKALENIVDESVHFAREALKNTEAYDVESYRDYSIMKEKLTMEVVSAEANKNLLKTVPHKNIEDMAIVYRFDLNPIPGTILVTNQLLEGYGITAEQLHEDALEIAPKNRPLEIKGMSEILSISSGAENIEDLGLNIPPEEEKLFVASVEGNIHGACVLAYEEFMDKAAERLGGSFYILPSSLHELILVPDDGNFELTALDHMVREVNATTVSSTDKLTDNVYHYDSENKIFETGEKYIIRHAEEKKKQDIA